MNYKYRVRCVAVLVLFLSMLWMELQQQQTIAQYELQNQQLEASLRQQRQELSEVSRLAEEQTSQLWAELDKHQLDLMEVSRLLNQSRPLAPHRPLLAARAGRPKRLRESLVELQHLVQQHESQLAHLSQSAQEMLRHSIPNGSPCAGEMTSGFGCRVHPIYGIGKFHQGCDFTAPYSTKIFATADGVVLRSDWLGGYGKVVELQHPSGLCTLYAHCQDLKVAKGQRVAKGQWIATVGQTGLASGPHCHYEVHRNGKQINPEPFLSAILGPQPE
ncbi:peptidoglycan DD-metalloendopeptidase family protein [bacterium]|nr:peptidoglycan DD-metalloendopeptidase family protein [bacterium]